MIGGKSIIADFLELPKKYRNKKNSQLYSLHIE